MLHTWIGAACDKGLFGWPCDPEIEKLRSAYGFAQTDEEKMKIARDLQTRAIEQVVYVPFGQWTQPLAYRADRIDGIVPEHRAAGVLEHHARSRVTSARLVLHGRRAR